MGWGTVGRAKPELDSRGQPALTSKPAEIAYEERLGDDTSLLGSTKKYLLEKCVPLLPCCHFPPALERNEKHNAEILYDVYTLALMLH